MIYNLMLILIYSLTSCEPAPKTNIVVPSKVNDIHFSIEEWNKSIERQDNIYVKNGVAFTGNLEYSSSGKRFYLELKDGLLNGRLDEWYTDESKRTERMYEKGYENGTQQGWHSNGNLSYIYQSLNGLRRGPYLEYYPSGDPQIISDYDNGFEYKKKVYDINGKILVNYEIREGRYYGLLGSSSCISNLKNYGKATIEE